MNDMTDDNTEIAIGQVWIAEDASARQVVVITGMPPSFFLRAHVAHSSPEMATDFDLIFPAGEITEYPLVFCGELYCLIQPKHLVTLLGQISDEQAQAIRAALLTDAESLAGMNVGMPLGLRNDPRRHFLERACVEVNRLSHATRALMIEEGSTSS